MIPKRIRLQGFLCYKDEQEIAFDGSSLWMLAGLNGSGKSTVFDAVTFALFGHHRGGSQGATDLICKGENGFVVEFEFTLDGELFQIRRTLRRRGTGTVASQQISQWKADRWEPLTDTHLKKEFDKWVSQHVGLNYETFTSSVLLLQGRAEKLLDSTAKGRAEVLASIVDLERYQKLHEKADGRRKELRGRAEALQAQWDHIPEVTDWELTAAANRIEDAGEALGKAQQEVDRLQGLEFQARQWAEAERKLAAAVERRRKAGQVVQEAAAIDRDLARFRELRDVLPHVETILLNRTNLSRSEETTKELAASLRDLNDRLGHRDHELDMARHRKSQLQKRLADEEARQQTITRQLPSLSALAERAKQVEQRRDEAKRLADELASLPSDWPRRLADAQKRLDELTAVQQALSPLGRLYQLRVDLKSARDRAASAETAEKTILAKGEELKAKLGAVKPGLEAARSALQTAQEEATAAKALLHEAIKLRDEFDRLEGSKVCRSCGQPLTPAHFLEEKARREKDRTGAEARSKSAAVALKSAQTAERKTADEVQALEEQIRGARDEYRDNRARLTQAQADITRLAQECGREHTELAEPFRSRVAAAPPADWLATTYPTAADLDEARRTAAGVPAARQELEKVREGQSHWVTLNKQVADAQQAAADLAGTLTADPADIRRNLRRLEADQKEVAESLRLARQDDREQQAVIDRLIDECQGLRDGITQTTGKLHAEEEKRKLCQQAIANARKALSPDWRVQADSIALAELNRLRSEKEALEKGGVEQRAEQLKQARVEVESLNRAVADLERERDQFPRDCRRDPAAVQQELKQARADATRCSDELNAERNERANLEDRRKQRAEIRSRLDDAERELNRYKLLAELLGRDRLQRHLVRQAERQIVDYANGVLDRLSGGQLMLRLCGGDDGAAADRALELEAYNRATGQSPINVAFLSGSQRFRVAVSLALGIGQYASRQHRPIQSVIIDEGFGCLDRQGRQVMIQELQNLRSHLHCILLVSHQEEFAEAFADGYRFELANGSTKVTRFQR